MTQMDKNKTTFKHQASEIYFTTTHSPLGLILIAKNDKGVCNIAIGDVTIDLIRDLQRRHPRALIKQEANRFKDIVKNLLDYLKSPTKKLDITLDITGTAFQKKVWFALQKIPFGKTASYAEIARQILRPTAARAVAQACGANPLAIIIPCHRVICSNGAISGYRWGVERKQILLKNEALHSAP